MPWLITLFNKVCQVRKYSNTALIFVSSYLMLMHSCSEGVRHISADDDGVMGDGCFSWSQQASWRTGIWFRPWLLLHTASACLQLSTVGVKYRLGNIFLVWNIDGSLCVYTSACVKDEVSERSSLFAAKDLEVIQSESSSRISLFSLSCSGSGWYALVECIYAEIMIWLHLCVVQDGGMDHGLYEQNSGEQCYSDLYEWEAVCFAWLT